MKTSNKSSLITGVVLLALAALFSISLILQLLDFGMAGPGHNNILFYLGNMLFSVYGFSSILIPGFLLISGLSCFASVWTARKTMRLLTALIPFFTCVVTEKIIRSIVDLRSDFSFVKIIIALITGAMLVVIEFLGVGIIADKINSKTKVKLPKETEDSEENTDNDITVEEEVSEPTIFDDALAQVKPEEVSVPEEKVDENDVENPKTMITQEEFAALTTQEDEQPAEELEWPDLPPQPEQLPPEYDEDFDENDPALEFPPKDDNEISEPEESAPVEEEDPYSFAEISEIENTVETTENDDVEQEEQADDPYSTTKYLDKVVENPKFPHGIMLHDEDETVEEENPVSETPKPKFPTRIQLDNNSNNEIEYDSDFDVAPVMQFESKPEEDDDNIEEDPYVPDETLPFPDFGEEVVEEEIEAPVFEEEPQTVEEALSASFSSAAHDVFSDMEADIRQSQPQPKTPAKVDTEYDVNGNVVEKSTMPSLNSANNLTADELSDFFSTQQEENTPKTKEIVPEAKKNTYKKGPYIIPSDLLTAYKDDQYWIIDDATKQASLNLKQTLSEFNIEADIIGIKKGPVVTMFEILPAPGVKLSKIVALQDNIALSLAAQSVRIVAPIPGKQAVGIEVPNKNRSVVGFREIIEMDLPEWKKMAVPVILGKDILGKAQLIDLVKTPHMLIAGATGSGKSVCVNSLILSILYKRSFNDVKMILVDPKVVELKLYNNIPHLLTPVITEPKKAIQALQWCLCEMERRYALLDSMGVRDISNYNTKIKEQKICTEKLPYIVVIIDEFADLMATSGKELESIVARLTAMSRAVGIHLVLATQRPSVNVITGLIKANIPTRIAFMVASRTDSNIIIDTVGAEKLLGRGDMLFASAVDPAPIRIQGTFVSDQEAENVINAVKEYGEPDYLDEEIFQDDDEDTARDLFGEPMDDDDPLYDQALEIVVQEGKASASYLQRRLKIGYNRAARLVEEMEERGIVGPANGSKPREVIHIP